MSVKEFLQSVLPDEGYLIISTLAPTPDGKRKVWWNNVVTDLAEMQVKAREWMNEGKDVYFALASFAEREVFNPKKKNYKTGQMGAMEKRTQANAKFLRAFFLDLDVKPDKLGHYHSQEEALAALREFCKTTGLPKPTLVNSGYGLHAYWPLDTNVPRDDWLPVAEKLKDACTVAGLLADPVITADPARVLRIPGTKNFKNGTAVPVEVVWQTAYPYRLDQIDGLLDTYLSGKAIPKAAKRAPAPLQATPAPAAALGDNLGATNDPVNGNSLVFRCAQIQRLVADRGASAPYPVWWLGLGISRFTTDPKTFSLAVSDGHSDFDPTETQAKADSWTGGPPTCTKFWNIDPTTCEACPMWRKITTPVELGRPWKEDQPSPPALPMPDVSDAEVKILPPPPPPHPYVRVKQDDGSTHICLRTMDEDETPINQMICPYDLYPNRIMEETSDENKEADECSTWIVHQPRQRTKTFKMPQSMLSDTKKLHGFLLMRGLHINPREAKAVQFYMTAYLKELAKLADRERMFDRLGWHDDYNSFVFPDVIYHKDGTVTPHVSSKEIDSITKGGMRVKGTVEGWRDTVKFYSGPDNYSYRAGMYTGWASPLYGMTGQKGILVAFSGESGRGKTTLLETIASIYADPEAILIGGGKHGATTNAMYSITGTYHSFPVLWDDTTDRSAEDMSEFMLHISNGGGKERMKGNKHDGRVVTWRTMVISSANTDDINRIMATNKDPEARLMRYMTIEFNSVDRGHESKIAADKFKRGLREHYGHVGRIYIKYIVEHAQEVKEYIHKVMERFDRELKMQSQERHWSAFLACQYVGGRIAFKLGLSPFDPKDDLDWLKANIGNMRVSYAEAAQSPVEMITEFLETKLSNTLILQAKGSNNIDNVVRSPNGNGGLQIRRENDTGLIYIARSALNAWCEETKANYKVIEAALVMHGIILRKNCYKVLGADTTLAGGQTRCVEISRDKLEKFTGGKK